jgi:imidazolonepropionase-like amidohydrolase
MATVNPAKAGNVPDRKRGLAPGDRADFVLFAFDETSGRIDVQATFVSGHKVYESGDRVH